MKQEAEVKKELMQLEFELNSKLQAGKSEGQSLKKFESSGNDIVTGDMGLDKF